MKKISDRINGRLDIIEEKFSDCEFTTIKVSKMKCREKDWKINSITELYDNLKRPNMHITGLYKGGVW